MPSPSLPRLRWNPQLLAAVVLVSGLAMSLGAWWAVDTIGERAVEARFARATANVATRVDTGLTDTESTVLATRALLEASVETTAAEFSRFVAALAGGQPFADRFPDIAALAVVGADGTVELAAPEEAQARTAVADALAQPDVDRALRRATEGTQPVAVRLGDGGAGLAVAVAHYADPRASEPDATTQLRQRTLVGWVIALVDVERVLADAVLVAGEDQVSVTLRDSSGTVLGASGEVDPDAVALARDMALDRASGTLQLEIRVDAALADQVALVPRLVLLLGALLALASAGLVWLLVTQRQRALAQVDEATTALAASNAELKEANERLREFAGVVAHDLRGPLTAVHGMITTLALRIGDGLEPLDAELLARARRGSIQMDELIVDVLRYAEAGIEPTDLQVLDLAEVVEGVVERLEPLRQSGDTIDVAADCAVMADPTGLRRVLGNLIGNALKYRRDDQPMRVVVRAQRGHDRVTIEVADDGPGIPAELRTELLAPFRRGDTSRDGSGLGLAICTRIVTNHGGALEVDDADLGGALVRFDLQAA